MLQPEPGTLIAFFDADAVAGEGGAAAHEEQAHEEEERQDPGHDQAEVHIGVPGILYLDVDKPAVRVRV